MKPTLYWSFYWKQIMLQQRFPTFSCSRTPKEKKRKLTYPLVNWEDIFFKKLSVNLKLMKIWRTP